MTQQYFPGLPPVQFEGARSRNPLSYHHYQAAEPVRFGGTTKSMAEWLRFSMTWWHTMRGTGSDPFGVGTKRRPWDDGSGSVESDINTVKAAFELMAKLGIPYFAFHDRDLATEQDTLAATNRRLDEVVKVVKDEMGRTGIRLLWGTANLFSNRRYMHGAATSTSPQVFAFAAAQVKKAMEITHELGGAGYTFWGGREGYQFLPSTDMGLELSNLARLLSAAVDYRKAIGFDGLLYIEPKPKEPTKHQYDSDAAACLNFLRQFGLLDAFWLNLETNHATLAGHEMIHELYTAALVGKLGSIDANCGDTLLGWDTDHFLFDYNLAAQIMYVVLGSGGFTTGGVNFDAKTRRESVDPIDLAHAHIGSMDAFAIGLKIAAAIHNDGRLDSMRRERYSGWHEGLGVEITRGKHTLESLERVALGLGEVPELPSGREEQFARLIAEYAFLLPNG